MKGSEVYATKIVSGIEYRLGRKFEALDARAIIADIVTQLDLAHFSGTQGVAIGESVECDHDEYRCENCPPDPMEAEFRAEWEAAQARKKYNAPEVDQDDCLHQVSKCGQCIDCGADTLKYGGAE